VAFLLDARDQALKMERVGSNAESTIRKSRKELELII
jgi:hypothetical protein